VTSKLLCVYRIRATAGDIEARARAIAIEQSVEMPVDAICDETVKSTVVGRVLGITDRRDGTFDATIALATETTGFEAGQLLNMLFGNSSIHDDVTLADITVPPDLSARFGGPRFGPAGLAARVNARDRALTCSAIKPQGLPAAKLAEIAGKLAHGGLDYIKDDHGLADQSYAPFADRVSAIAAAVRAAAKETGKPTRYLPSLSGNLDALRQQVRHSRDNGLDTLLIAPMIIGLPSFQTIVRENADMAFIAHPAMAGAARIHPAALFGRLFRMIGADGIIYPNSGGRFGYSTATCREIAASAGTPWSGIKASLPVPAGGMTLARVPEILKEYGTNAMLLIGGDLLAARENMTREARLFQKAIETFDYGCVQSARAVS
jgi:ribulose-bisphosphate carboxylase large chain